MDIQTDKLAKQFFSDGYKLGSQVKAAQDLKECSYAPLKQMYAAIDEMNQSFLLFAKQQNHNVDCKIGCAWCCHQPIFALEYELEYLNDFLVLSFEPKKIKEIAKHAHYKANLLDKLQGQELLNSKYPCPLLKNSVCLAYKARPVACRIYLSSDVNSCKHFYKIPDDKNKFPALLDLPLRLGRMMNQGFNSALKSNGIEMGEFRIEQKVPK